MTVQIDIQTIEYPAASEKPQFAFLAKPPPQQKRRPSPNTPLPSPPGPLPPAPTTRTPVHRSNAYSGILAWAALVQPGSPGSPPPRSPHRRPSITSNSSRRPSISRLNRRTSISHGRARSGSFILVDTPTRTQHTPSVPNFDLTTLGYTSVFVHLPKTPTTPSPYLRQYQHTREPQHGNAQLASMPLSAGPLSPNAFAHIPIPPIPTEDAAPKSKGMKRFRSLAILRPRGSKAKSAGPSSPSPLSPTKTAMSTKSSKSSKTSKKKPLALDAAAISKSKQAKYAHVRPPPPLANDLAMMQFADGGSMDDNVKRVMEAQAKAAKGSGAGVGVGDVYRDGKGGIWWDADEEMEYAPLLGGKTVQELMKETQDVDMEWEAFGSASASPLAPFLSREGHIINKDGDIVRRVSVSTQDSDLDPKYLVPLPENEDPRAMAVDDRVLASRKIGGPGMSVLCLPCRPRRAAPHLHKPAFLVDAAAFGPRSPRSPGFAVNARSPTSFGFSNATGKPRSKARRRPAPLKLANSAHGVVVRSRCSPRTPRSAAHDVVVSPIRRAAAARVPAVVIPSPGGAEKARREFIEDSFAPSPVRPMAPRMPPAYISVPVIPASSSVKALRRGGVRALFAIAKRSD